MKKTRLLEIIHEEIQLALENKGAIKLKKGSSDSDIKKYTDKGMDVELVGEENLNEMAKIAGDLKSAIEKVIQSNPDLEGLALKKKIKADKAVDDALEGDTIYDNQLNKFIALVKGEREVGQRGRKADPNKAKAEPKEPGQRGRKSSSKKQSNNMDDEDKEAAKAASSDSTAKSLASTPEEKKEKFNLGLKFIKKYKDDKPKIDAYLKKAKEEYKFSKSMMDDLKRTAGREVGA
jgi:hypothetical protein